MHYDKKNNKYKHEPKCAAHHGGGCDCDCAKTNDCACGYEQGDEENDCNCA